LHTWNRTWQPLDKEIATVFSSYWINFAKTGNPNGHNLPEWKNYNKQSGTILVVDDKIASKSELLKKEFDFLETNN
jgi:para-nitrobenzyl esterase